MSLLNVGGVGDGEAVGDGDAVGDGETVGVGVCATADVAQSRPAIATVKSAEARREKMDRVILFLKPGTQRGECR